MTDGDAHEPLRELERRLEAAQRGRSRVVPGDAPVPRVGDMLALAWRVGLELVAAVVVGAGIGWAIDRALGTRPWGMIVLFFLGVAAGMINVWRTVTGMGMAVGYRQPGNTAQDTRDDED